MSLNVKSSTWVVTSYCTHSLWEGKTWLRQLKKRTSASPSQQTLSCLNNMPSLRKLLKLFFWQMGPAFPYRVHHIFVCLYKHICGSAQSRATGMAPWPAVDNSCLQQVKRGQSKWWLVWVQWLQWKTARVGYAHTEGEKTWSLHAYGLQNHERIWRSKPRDMVSREPSYNAKHATWSAAHDQNS